MTAATRAELEAGERLSTAAGQAALALARRIDLGVESSGSALAALVKQLDATMAVALEGTRRREPDRLDELEARRATKRDAG